MELIDRKAILNRYQEICNGTACMDCPFNKDGCAVEKLILESAVVDAEPIRHGHWEVHEAFGYKDMTCSVCGWLYEYYGGLEEEWNYCPHCGCKMDEVNDEFNR